MTRYRIIQRPSYVNPKQPIYVIERHILWWLWEIAGTAFPSLEAAKQHIHELRQAEATNPIKQKVVYQDP